MATRSYRSIADQAKAQWSPDAHGVRAQVGSELDAELTAQIALGRELAAARNAASLTQTQLAKRAGVQQPEISRIERGLGNPTRDTLVRLAAAAGARVTIVSDQPPSTRA